jgi:hypothetical protein
MRRSTIGATIAAGRAAVLIGAFSSSAPVAAQAAETCKGRMATIVGTVGNDTVVGTEGDDVIIGWAGRADDIHALGGNDVVCAGFVCSAD